MKIITNIIMKLYIQSHMPLRSCRYEIETRNRKEIPFSSQIGSKGLSVGEFGTLFFVTYSDILRTLAYFAKGRQKDFGFYVAFNC